MECLHDTGGGGAIGSVGGALIGGISGVPS